MIEVVGHHHAGFAVDDLDAAVAFFAHFGFVAGERIAANPDRLARGNGLRDVSADVMFLEGHGGRIELVAWTGVDRPPPAPDEPGAGHICLQVADVYQAAAAARAAGLDVTSEPQVEESYGLAWLFVRGPSGLRVELMAQTAAD